MDADTALGIGFIAVAGIVVFAFVFVANWLFLLPLVDCGYRPWRTPTRQPVPRDSALERPDRLQGKALVGWPMQGARAPVVLTFDGERAHVVGGGARAVIERPLVGAVRTFPGSVYGPGFVFDSDDHRYGGIVIFPMDLAQAAAALRRQGWTVGDRHHIDTGATG